MQQGTLNFKEKYILNPYSMSICHAGDGCDYTKTGKGPLVFSCRGLKKKLMCVGDISNSNHNT